jgi:cytidine deaminase
VSDNDELVRAAEAARARAYAPYSRYQVGAAVRGDNGKIYTGANVENASYGLALCAERNAVAAAVLDGVRRLTAVAVITSTSPPAAPCGMCRQTLAEFARDLPVVLVNDRGERRETTLETLLPLGFRREDLP